MRAEAVAVEKPARRDACEAVSLRRQIESRSRRQEESAVAPRKSKRKRKPPKKKKKKK